MNPLDPRVTKAWRFVGTLLAFVFTAAASLIEMFVLAPAGHAFWMPGAPAALVALLCFPLALIWPSLRYRYWRWQVEADHVLIQKGVIWRSRSLIPRVRIQHVDTRSSPLQRSLGLSSLILYTAGTRGADAEIPGLGFDVAERLREELARLDELDERS